MQPKASRQGQEDHCALKVINPVGVLKFNPIPHAKRLKDLKNKKIGLYWNHKARGDVALERVKELLSERYTGMTFEWFETPVSVEAPKEWFGQVKRSKVDGIVAATGD